MTQQIEFKFKHSAFTDADQVKVVRFSGDEGISRLFEFSIELKSSNADIDIDAVLENQASLSISLEDDEREIQGIVSSFEAVRQVNNETLYKAVLSPRLWELSLYHTNEIYLDQTVPEIIETVLKEAGFTSLDYDLTGLQGKYKKWPYKCQFGESHLDFISRLMERDGIYYFFTQGDTGEKIIFCDSLQFQEKVANSEVKYSPAASMEINALSSNIHSFVSQQKRLPHKVLLKDFNDDKPSVDIKGEAIIDDAANPSSEIYVWGQNIETPEEGKMLAEVRAEEIRSGKKNYHGESAVVRLIPGFNFTLSGHFRQSCNQDYLLVSINHEGVDPSSLDLSGQSQEPVRVYSNSFMSIAADVQFRSEQLTQKPEINGTLNAFVDSNGTGEYADVDEEGRYRVTLPFDRVDRDGGKASHWIRMSQPFGGENQGMHFPLRKGGAVLLTFIGGDPDRPVIASSIPNASQPSVVNAENHTNSLIKTGAGNKIELEDKDGKNRIKLQTGDNKTYMHLGAPNHPGDGWVVITDGMERKEITGGQQITIKTNLPTAPMTTKHAATGSPTTTTTITKTVTQIGTVIALQLPVSVSAEFSNKEVISAIWSASGVTIGAASKSFPFNASVTVTGSSSASDVVYTLNVVIRPDVFDETAQYSFSPRDASGRICNTMKSGNLVRTISNPDTGALISNPDFKVVNAAGVTKKTLLVGSDVDINTVGDKTESRFTQRGELGGKFLFERTLGDKYVWEQGNEYRFNSPGDTQFFFGTDQEVVLCQSDTSLDAGYIKNDETYYSKNQTANQNIDTAWKLMDEIVALGTKMTGYQCFHGGNEGGIRYDGVVNTMTTNKWNDLLDNKSQVRIAEHNTFNIQHGNIFDFGGYWNYNLGNSYVENHGAQRSEVNRKDDHDKVDVAGPHWQKIAGDLVTITRDADTGGKEAIEKTYCDSYSYTKGNTLEVSVGNSESHVHGDSHSEVHGHSIEHVRGSSHSTHHGATNEMFMGAANSMAFSVSSDVHMGLSNDMFVGGKVDLSVSYSKSFCFGMWTELAAGIKSEIFTGQAMSFVGGLSLEVKAGTHVSTDLSELKAGVTAMEQIATDLKNSGLELTSKGIDVATGGIKMIS